VLDAHRSLFNARLNLVNVQSAIYVGLIITYKAMGGGWVELADGEADKVEFPDGEYYPSNNDLATSY
jgi:multidrug efflux system outer membrane protein